jgi:hypothetical protein
LGTGIILRHHNKILIPHFDLSTITTVFSRKRSSLVVIVSFIIHARDPVVSFQVDDYDISEKNMLKFFKKQIDDNNLIDALEDPIIPKCIKLTKSLFK